MSEHEMVRVKCYTLVIEAVTKKDAQKITTAIGGVRNEGGRGHAKGPFKLYEEGENVAQTICVQKGDASARNWRISVDNVEPGEFPVFHAEKDIDIRKTRTVTFVIEDGNDEKNRK